MQSQSALNRWFSDFELCARTLRHGAFSPELVSLLLPPGAEEDDDAHTLRSRRILKAYRYALANAPAFENIGEMTRNDDGRIQFSVGVIYSLYLFFSSDLYGHHEPELELVIDAALRVPDGASNHDMRGF